MTVVTCSVSPNALDRSPAWGAVFAMALCCTVLIASEFLPVSLLTPLAADLRMTEGQAGQAISISGLFAVLGSLFVSGATAGRDRRTVLLVLTGLMVVSGAVVAVAPNYPVLMAGRAVLGIAIGGFWSMSAAAVMRLVPEDSVPRALAILNGGNALAATVAAPLGSFVAAYVGWRGAFFCVVPLAAFALAWQLVSLPAMPSAPRSGAVNVFGLLRRPVVAWGTAAIMLFFMGQFALFTYLRPFLEVAEGVDVPTLSSILLLVGVAGLVGTSLIGVLLKRGVYGLLIALPLLMGVIAVGLSALGHWLLGTVILLGLWGLIGTAAPVAWNTWLTRTLPDDAEAGGGLMVAAIQLAITLGATVGGLIFDLSGYRATFAFAAALLGMAALIAAMARRARRFGT
jgi:predicted MFS family arabinose efflux permease